MRSSRGPTRQPKFALVCFVAALVGVPAPGSSQLFETRGYSFLPECLHLEAAELDGDGKPDLLASTATGVAVLLGRGNGLFTTTVELGVQGGPVFTRAADLSGDGAIDIIAVHATTGLLSLFRGRGDGTFETWTSLSTGATRPRGLAVADVNRDGHADVVVGHHGDRHCRTFLGQPDGAFLGVSWLGPRLFLVMSLHDLDDDGFADLVGSDGLETRVLLGSGNGRFNAGEFVYDHGAVTGGLTLADLSEDGNVDLAIADTSGVWVRLGMGGGQFGAAVRLATEVYVAITAADFDGDSHADIAVSTMYKDIINNLGSGKLLVWRGTGDGTLVGAWEGLAAARWITSADFDGDGRRDLALAGNTEDGEPRGLAGVLLAATDGTFGGGRNVDIPCGWTGLEIGRTDADTIPDLVFALDTQAIAVVPGTSDGGFGAPQSGPPGCCCTPPSGSRWMSAGDLNGDGWLDVVTSNSEWKIIPPGGEPPPFGGPCTDVYAHLGGGGGDFAAPLTTTVGNAPMRHLLAGMDADGRLDVVVLKPDSLTILLGEGDGTFKASFSVAPGHRYWPRAADVNGDGNQDVLMTWDTLSVFLGNGDGTLGSRIDSPTGWTGSYNLGDVDGDGDLDLVSIDDDVEVFLGDDSGRFTQAPQTYYAPYPGDLDLADLDADGDLDLVVTTGRTVQAALVYLGRGDGTFEFDMGYSTGTGPRRVDIHDLNGDGRPDLLASGACSSDLLRNRLGPLGVTPQPQPPGTSTAPVVPLVIREGKGGMVEIRYGLARKAPVDLAIFDVRGRRLWREPVVLHDPGSYARTWDRRDLAGVRVPRGLYAARLVVGEVVTTRKFVLLGP